MKEMSEEKKMEMMKKKQGLFLLREPNIIRKGYQLSVNVLKGEAFTPFENTQTIDSFVSVRAVGCVLTTRTVENNFSPLYAAKL